tara:strand:- start:1193 stop:1363 length:171 start_codon:yes stop_codon:yes gene_type:complete
MTGDYLKQKNIFFLLFSIAENGTLRIEVGDGWEGYPELAPFDAIHVGAGAETLPKV